MSGSLNKCILIGNVGRDPEIRDMQNGKRVANLSIATSETWKDKATGEKREKTEWHRVVAFSDGLVRVIEQYVHKGSKVYVEGALQTRKWTDKDGIEKYSTEIVLQGYNGKLVLLGDKKGEGGAPQQPQQQKVATYADYDPQTKEMKPGYQDNVPHEDEIPF